MRQRTNQPSKQAKRYLELKAQGKSYQEIADICGRETFTVYMSIRTWTDPAFREHRRALQAERNERTVVRKRKRPARPHIEERAYNGYP